MLDSIVKRLKSIETSENIVIIYACESGSRAWGFPSIDSDYDVRFIYARPTDWYLSIDEKRDVIDFPVEGEIDLVGWDLRKSLQLLRKSNPPLLEWLGSPIVYLERREAVSRLRSLASECYSPKACMFHYLHMAQGNHREYLQGDSIWVKKYFYVLRPLLAIKWIEMGFGIAPTHFDKLVDATVSDPELKQAIAALIEIKNRGEELGQGPRVPVISEYIDHELDRLSSANLNLGYEMVPIDQFDKLFREILAHVWNEQWVGPRKSS